MADRVKDQALLAVLDQEERAALEEIVADFVGNELAAETGVALHLAAIMFEEGSVRYPPIEGVTGLLFAAALRERAVRLSQ